MTLHAAQEQASPMHKANNLIAAYAMRELEQVWASILDYAELNSTLPQAIAAMQAITERWGNVSAVVASEFYQTVREDAGVASAYVPDIAPPAVPEQVEASVKWATKSLWGGDTDAQTAALALTEGVIVNLSLEPGRDTIIQAVESDKKALGWARVTDGHPCAFCSMLASRGPVYKTQQSAGFQAHNHEMCTPVPFFSNDDATLLYSQKLYDDWKHVTAGQSGKNALKAWRKWWDNGGAKQFTR